MSGQVRNPVVLLVLGALGLWGASRFTWLSVEAFNDQSGAATRELVGADWQPGLVALALASVAAVLGVALTRGLAARAVGAVVVVLGVAGAVLALSGFTEVDTDRVHSVVTQSEESSNNTEGAASGPTSGDTDGALPAWSQITGVESHRVGPAVAGAGALLVLVSGALLVVSPPVRSRVDSRYETPGVQRERAAGAVASEADQRSLWESIEAGEDPTDHADVGVDADEAGGADHRMGGPD